MMSVPPIKSMLQIVAVMLGSSLVATSALGESFDKPIKKVVVEVGRSTHFSPNDDRDFRLDCFYYPAFMVKQLWAKDWKGTVTVKTLSSAPGRFPPCIIARDDPGESGGEDGWFFVGAKGQLLFWEDPDGLNGGQLFRIVDWKTDKKIFEDTALIWDGRPIPLLDFGHYSEGKTLIRYRRVVVGDCSIAKDGLSCWSKLKVRFGLGSAPIPKCTGYRQPGQKPWAYPDPGVPAEEIGTESALAYPVEVELFPQPLIKPVPGRIKCSAEE
jgi:hypothetical protein